MNKQRKTYRPVAAALGLGGMAILGFLLWPRPGGAPEERGVQAVARIEPLPVAAIQPVLSRPVTPEKPPVEPGDGAEWPVWRLAAIAEMHGAISVALVDGDQGDYFWLRQGEQVRGMELVSVASDQSSATFRRGDQTRVWPLEAGAAFSSVDPGSSPGSTQRVRGAGPRIAELPVEAKDRVMAGGVHERPRGDGEPGDFLLEAEIREGFLRPGATRQSARVGGGELTAEQAAYVFDGGLLAVVHDDPETERPVETIHLRRTVLAGRSNVFINDLGSGWLPFLLDGGVVDIQYE